MEKLPCSIFNDVLGPVMRGPSSSHVAGAARIASMIRQSLDAPVKKAIVDFDVNGALAASHTGHGTDMGFASGLLNMELDAPDVAQYEAIAKERGLECRWRSPTARAARCAPRPWCLRGVTPGWISGQWTAAWQI